MQNPGRKTAFSGEWRNALGLIKSAGQGHRIAEQELNLNTGQGKPAETLPQWAGTPRPGNYRGCRLNDM